MILTSILKDTLALRDGEAAKTVTMADLAARLDVSVRMRPRRDPMRRLVAHVRNEYARGAVLRFLEEDCDATNWRAEQAIRVLVVNRKVWGGNRTDVGAHTQEILSSFFATAQEQNLDPVDILIDLQTTPQPSIAPFTLTPDTR